MCGTFLCWRSPPRASVMWWRLKPCYIRVRVPPIGCLNTLCSRISNLMSSTTILLSSMSQMDALLFLNYLKLNLLFFSQNREAHHRIISIDSSASGSSRCSRSTIGRGQQLWSTALKEVISFWQWWNLSSNLNPTSKYICYFDVPSFFWGSHQFFMKVSLLAPLFWWRGAGWQVTEKTFLIKWRFQAKKQQL